MTPARARVLTEGLIAGGIGYVVVALFYGILDVIQGSSPFEVAALLGSALFYAAETAAPGVVAPGPVLAFNGLHLVLFLLLGVGVAWLVAKAERYPAFWYPVFSVLVVGFILTYLAVLVVANQIVRLLPAWSVGVANLLAGLGMGFYLWRAHPRLRSAMREYTEEDAPSESRTP